VVSKSEFTQCLSELYVHGIRDLPLDFLRRSTVARSAILSASCNCLGWIALQDAGCGVAPGAAQIIRCYAFLWCLEHTGVRLKTGGHCLNSCMTGQFESLQTVDMLHIPRLPSAPESAVCVYFCDSLGQAVCLLKVGRAAGEVGRVRGRPLIEVCKGSNAL